MSTAVPQFFRDALAWRAWLEAHAETATELTVGFHKVGTGVAGMRWSESVDEALCFGWIDGVRRRIDDAHYQIRFTPRRQGSIWSQVNIDKVARLQAEGRMMPAGLAAFALRSAERSAIYSHEQVEAAELRPEELREFRSAAAAWDFFEGKTPPSYRRQLLHWVCSAKREQTRAARLAKLIAACERGERLGW